MKEWMKTIGGVILAAVLFVACFVGLAWMVGRVIDDAATELDNNGGLKAIAERVWNGKGDE